MRRPYTGAWSTSEEEARKKNYSTSSITLDFTQMHFVNTFSTILKPKKRLTWFTTFVSPQPPLYLIIFSDPYSTFSVVSLSLVIAETLTSQIGQPRIITNCNLLSEVTRSYATSSEFCTSPRQPFKQL